MTLDDAMSGLARLADESPDPVGNGILVILFVQAWTEVPPRELDLAQELVDEILLGHKRSDDIWHDIRRATAVLATVEYNSPRNEANEQ